MPAAVARRGLVLALAGVALGACAVEFIDYRRLRMWVGMRRYELGKEAPPCGDPPPDSSVPLPSEPAHEGQSQPPS